MIEEIFIALFVGIIIFEIIEHIVFPFIWLVLQKRKKSVHDLSSLVGKVGEVKQWKDLQGKIFIYGELWNAKSDVPLSHGDKAIIERVEGFVLTVKKVPTVCDSKETT